MTRNAATKKKEITFTKGSVLDKPAGLSINVPSDNEENAAAAKGGAAAQNKKDSARGQTAKK